jgi:hypothetical protein
VPAVAQESGVSSATIYRRDDLFRFMQQANPAIQRRQTEQMYHQTITRLEGDLTQAHEELEAYRHQAQVVRMSERRPQREMTQLLKENLVL